MAGTKNKLSDLRNHLFETLEALKDPDKPMELERAKAIVEVAQVLVDSAKVEVNYIEAVGNISSEFLELEAPTKEPPMLPASPNGKNGNHHAAPLSRSHPIVTEHRQ